MNFMINESAQKLRGGYYTPDDLAKFLSRWILEISPSSILEPSCGDGSFLKALHNSGVRPATKITALELDGEEAEKSRSFSATSKISAEILTEDFLGWALRRDLEGSFDAVIGNPPFIRYQYLPKHFQQNAEKIFGRLNLPFTKHTNAWVPFILAAIRLLRPGGRLAMVVPAEIIHVLHAQSLRSYLGNTCRRLVIVDPEALWFKGTLQGAVILMTQKAESFENMEGLGIVPVKDREFTHHDPSEIFAKPIAMNGETVAGKWTRALLSEEARSLLKQLSQHPEVYRFGDIARVDVGIVTGANKFFLVNDETVREHDLEHWAHPMFGRSEHCPGVVYDEQQHLANAQAGTPTNFLWFRDDQPLRNRKPRAYIESGEADELHTRYKCRIRAPWFTVPYVYSTEVGMLKRSHDTPRLILNKLGAYTTDTAYRVRTTGNISPEKLVGCFINGLTALSAELEGRHYGGGVLELVPSEIERLVIPAPAGVQVNLQSLDQAVRHNRSMEETIRCNGENILRKIGVSCDQHNLLIDSWKRLRNRRHRIPN